MANERLRATSWRFEQIKTATNSLAIAQHKNINAQEKSIAEILDNQKIQKSSFKISWNNNFDILNQKYALKNQHNGLNDELKIIRKANILVRRDALKKLYNADYAMYERELNAKGFTIHRERL